MKIIGIDIIKGSARSRPRYAVYYTDESVEWSKDVSKHRLLKYIADLNPDIVAVDNIFELFEDRNELIEFLKSIPHSIRLIQTAGKFSLPMLAKRYGIRINPKNPFDEARASALLAKYGVGEEVSVFADKTIIKVSRNRSLGKGGWRQNKYRRKVHDAVRSVYREIKRILDDHGLEYVEDVREAYGGLSRGTLLVNSPRDKIPISSFKTKDVQVSVTGVEKEKIEFIPIKKQIRHLIVGIDPGATVGVALIDLDGNIVAVASKKGWSYSDVVEFILSHGKPVVISTDKKNPPDYVLKIKASFNCTLYTPKEDIPVEKKKSLTSNFKIVNDHERDALASAIEAFNAYKNKFRNIEKRLPEGIDYEEVKAGIIRGMSLKFFIESKVEERKVSDKYETRIDIDEIKKRDRIISDLKHENMRLMKEISELKKEISRLQEKIHRISSEEHRMIRESNHIKMLESEIKTLRESLKEKDRIIKELESKIEELRKIKYLEFRGWKAIKSIKKFTVEEIENLISNIGLEEGEVIFIEDVSGGGKNAAELLVNMKVRAIIFSGNMSHYAMEIFERNKIPYIPAESINYEKYDDFVLVRKEDLEKEIKKRKEEMERQILGRIEEMLLDYKNRRKTF